MIETGERPFFKVDGRRVHHTTDRGLFASGMQEVFEPGDPKP
jgi:hypothetical protein